MKSPFPALAILLVCLFAPLAHADAYVTVDANVSTYEGLFDVSYLYDTTTQIVSDMNYTLTGVFSGMVYYAEGPYGVTFGVPPTFPGYPNAQLYFSDCPDECGYPAPGSYSLGFVDYNDGPACLYGTCSGSITITAAPGDATPEPQTWLLLLVGMAALYGTTLICRSAEALSMACTVSASAVMHASLPLQGSVIESAWNPEAVAPKHFVRRIRNE